MVSCLLCAFALAASNTLIMGRYPPVTHEACLNRLNEPLTIMLVGQPNDTAIDPPQPEPIQEAKCRGSTSPRSGGLAQLFHGPGVEQMLWICRKEKVDAERPSMELL